MVKKYIIAPLGWIVMVIGIVAIFTPGLPATPLLMLAAWIFARSSRRFYVFIHRNKYTGRYLNNYRRKGGMTPKAKLFATTLMCSMMAFSVILFLWPDPISWVVIGGGIVGTITVIFFVPNAKR